MASESWALSEALRDTLLGAGEVAGTIGSGMVAQPLAGIYGLGTLLRNLPKGKDEAVRRASENIEKATEAMTYQPRTSVGQRGLENIGKVIDPISTALRENVADPVGNVSPLLGAALVALPEALPGPGKVRAPRVKKPPKSVASVFENVTDPAVARQMAMTDKHIKVDPTSGKYIGAPEQVDSPQALGTMRRDALEKVRGGMFNADWYDRQRALAQSLSDDPTRQSLFSRGTAGYSPQAMPKVELPTFLSHHNQMQLQGELTRTPRTEAQARKVSQAYTVDPVTMEVTAVDPSKIKLGRKTGPYGEAKDPTVPAESLFKAPSDIWHGRVMGYPGKGGKPFSRGFTPQETGFLTGENIRLTEAAKAEGMPVGDVKGTQAASWGTVRMEDLAAEDAKRFAKETKARAQYEKNPEKWKKKNTSERKLDPGEMGPPREGEVLRDPQMGPARPITKSIPAKNPKPVRTEEELRAYASEGLDTAKPRQAANLTSEAITGADTGHLAGLQQLSDPVKLKYTSDILRATGRDPVIERLGMFSEKPEATTGIYKNKAGGVERQPGWVDRVMVSNVGDSGTGIRTPGIEREALDLAAQTGAYLRGQEFGAWNRFLPGSMSPKVGQMNAARVKDLTPAEADKLVAAGLSPVDVGEGTHHVTRFGKEGPPVVGSQKDVEATLGRGERGTLETGYQEGIGAKDTEGTGVATDRLIGAYEQSNIANVADRMGTSSRVPSVAQAQNTIDRALAQEHNLPVREDLMKARSILAEGGIPALIAYVKKYGSQGLPVALLGALGLQQMGQQEGEV